MPSIEPFDQAFNMTMAIEKAKELTNIATDPGGMTYAGISRVHHPSWTGWPIIDEGITNNRVPHNKLSPIVKQFYKENFWYRIQGPSLAELSTPAACEVFDTAVNLGVHQAVKILQEAVKVASGDRIKPIRDGILGPKTLKSVRDYIKRGNRKINEEILLNCLNGEQYILYKNNPNRVNNRGWFRRV